MKAQNKVMRDTYCKTPVLLLAAACWCFSVSTGALGQEQSRDQQDQSTASIEKMRKRVAEIELKLKSAATEHAQSLGEEAFALINQIEETYLQMENSYQQQVVQLNAQVREVWEEIESSENDTRDTLDKKLQILQSDWDRIYDRLTKTHDSHLDQIKEDLARLRGDLSVAAGRAQAELESSRFEMLARWEKAHEIFLKINQTYVNTVGDQLQHLQQKLQEEPQNRELSQRLNKVQDHYFLLQERWKKRNQAHLEHLQHELQVRRLQLTATVSEAAKSAIEQLIDQLCHRKHATFADLQASNRETITTLASAIDRIQQDLKDKSDSETPILKNKLANLRATLAETRKSLQASYLERTQFIDDQMAGLKPRLPNLSGRERDDLQSKIDDLLALRRKLDEMAAKLAANDDGC